ncbi:PREDICTED: protein FAR-RED IMPAIRED RESPONSE 1-like [Lupinus angustifolius]|uniref:protein FAR-RED IMPAIRED RESPONSE 1-like n=1 Tax=Lupinus angustifolius TaxID=3871 RepID=UPI00092E626B|nr:PREDICTED: protein FAR-RED IMPAIRED RESPONSE 1-like [Lupinus angustifolius]
MSIGVDHHKLSTIFGAELLYDETAEIFVWLFETLAKSMLGKKPQTILTDQDATMAKNALKNLSVVFGEFQDFNKNFSKCIYEYEEEDEFNKAWDDLLDNYGLRGNRWMDQTFALKEKWALVYGRQKFCGDMMITQRNESMNNVIKKYVSYKHDMIRFFHHFERLVDDRRYQQLKADFKATQRSVSLSFNVEIVRHTATIYTPAVFKMFEKEVSLSYDCNVIISFEIENVSEYKVMSYKKHFQHSVKYDSLNDVVTCSSKKFEFAGILCSHALKVLSTKNIMRTPMIYVLKRWTKQAKTGSDRGTCLSPTHDDANVRLRNRYKDLCGRYTELTTKGATNEEAYKLSSMLGTRLWKL